MNNKIIVSIVTSSTSKNCKLQGDQVLPLTKFKLSFLLKMQTEMLIPSSNDHSIKTDKNEKKNVYHNCKGLNKKYDCR